MIQKKFSTGYEGRDKMVKGANDIADAVKRTFGPGGQNFAIEKGNRITNDGFTIAKEMIGGHEDEFEHRGAVLFVDAMNKANDEAGDFSTTTAILTQSVLKSVLPYLPSKDKLVGKLSPMQLIKKVEEERKEITKLLAENATAIESKEDLIKVATVSVESEALGELIGTAQWELGPEGVILAEEVNDKESSVEMIKGIRFDSGFGTSAVINNPEKEALELKDVPVIYTNHTISDISVVQGVIESLINMGHKQIVIMSRGFTQDAIQQCLKNMESGLGIFPLNAPYTDQAEIMLDLQAVLGGRFINTDSESLENVTVVDVGHATHILAQRSATVFAGKGEGVEERVKELKAKKKGSGSDFEKKNIDSRIAQLTNGFALLKVGSDTVMERKYLKDKADDAVNTVRNALQEGVVKGGGQALNDIANSLSEDFILKEAIRAPHQTLLRNVGADFVIEDWVKDSVKGLKIALEKACSVAPVLATAAGVIATKRPSELETLLKK